MAYNQDRDSIFSIYNKLLEEQNAGVQIMDPGHFKAFETKLVRAKFNLFKKYPFFGILLQKMKTVPVTPEEVKSYGIETMAVDNFKNIFINTNFVVNVLSDDEVMGVLAHEVMHIATMTFSRQRGRDMQLWNIATDYIMNRDLLIQGIALPKLGLLPVDENGRWIVKIEEMAKSSCRAVKGPKGQNTGVSVKNKIKNIDVTDLTAEQLYDILLKMKQTNNECWEKIGQMLKEMGEQMDKHLDASQSQQIQGQQAPNGDPVYTKNVGGGKSDMQAQNENKAAVQEAAQQASDEAKKRGTDPGMPRSFDKKLLQGRVNWKQLLKNFIVGSTVVKTDWSRPSRRLSGGSFFHPRKYAVKDELQAVVAIDTSGSISDAVLKTFLSEIINIIKTYRGNKIKMTVLLWDTKVADAFDVDTSKMNVSQITTGLMKMKATGGGTDISCIQKYLEKKNPGEPIKGGLLVFTDGYVEDNPILPKAPKKLFLITKDGSDEILKKYGPTYFIDVELT